MSQFATQSCCMVLAAIFSQLWALIAPGWSGCLPPALAFQAMVSDTKVVQWTCRMWLTATEAPGPWCLAPLTPWVMLLGQQTMVTTTKVANDGHTRICPRGYMFAASIAHTSYHQKLMTGECVTIWALRCPRRQHVLQLSLWMPLRHESAPGGKMPLP